MKRQNSNYLNGLSTVILIITAITMMVYSCNVQAKQLPIERNPYLFSHKEQTLVDDVSAGFLRAIQRESMVWRECGKRTNVEDQHVRASEIISNLYQGLRHNGLFNSVYLWATAATVWHESRGDPCAVGPFTRRWAVQNNLVSADVHFTKYTREDVKRMVDSRQWKTRRRRVGGDFGIGQNVWKKWAKMRDPDTGEERFSTIDEILSVKGGAYVVGYNMRARMKWYGTRQPWKFWPGKAGRMRYPRVISRVINWMGGPYRKVSGWKDST